MATKINCWEFKHCGREPGGSKIKELGICPASSSGEHNGINNGANGGRYCWAVAGTFCKGEIQGTAAMKRLSCLSCEFFNSVKDEEDDFKMTD